MNTISREVKTWLNGIDAKKGTQRNYIQAVDKYCEYLQSDIKTILDSYIAEIKEGKLMSERSIFHDLPGFIAELKERGLAPKTINGYRAAMKSLFRHYYIDVPHMKTGRINTLPGNSNRFLKREQVREMLNHAIHLRNRAVIMVMATSGIASNEIRNLKIGQISFDDNDIGTVRLRREKAEHDFYTFLSPEATATLKEYWKERERVLKQCKDQRDKGTGKCFIKKLPQPGQSIKDADWQYYKDCTDCHKCRGTDNINLVDTDYVFTGLFKEKIVQNVPLSERVFLRMFNQIGIRAGYEAGTKTKMSETRSHALRKYFSNSLQRAGVVKSDIDWCLGHVPDDTDKAYFDTSEVERIKEEYITHLAALAINEDIIIETADLELIREQAEELAQLKERLSKVEQDGDDMKEAQAIIASDPEYTDILAKIIAKHLK